MKEVNPKSVTMFIDACYSGQTRNEKVLVASLRGLKKIKEAARYAEKLSLECHAGHGLNIDNVSFISEINQVMELNVGYSLVCDSLIFGIEKSVKKFIKKINHY